MTETIQKPVRKKRKSPDQRNFGQERIMLVLTAAFILGVLIYGFVPPGTIRVVAMTLYTAAFGVMILKFCF